VPVLVITARVNDRLSYGMSLLANITCVTLNGKFLFLKTVSLGQTMYYNLAVMLAGEAPPRPA